MGFCPIGVLFCDQKSTRKVPLLPRRGARPRGCSPLGTPKMWSKKQKAKTCRSAARFLTLFTSSPFDPSGAKFLIGVGADSISARGILRSRQMPRNIAASRRGEQCSPERFYAAAHCHGRTMFAPTATVWLRVGGGVPDAPAGARTLRADIESAPTVFR